ncbi:uncharacterized protein [Venturia canescens]|uniref:uncharacterized protein isoform X2 n=1 Tax=Venturia canescens TaxID=32260 RepID=UPI001C9C7E1E|nr:uncharacterized protein LOC122407221 isoform X2 [Venturia canescens]
MRNPALHLVGIAASPGEGGVFGTRAEEELRLWLESRLDALGIDPVAYSRFVLSLLRRPDSALSPLAEAVGNARGGGRRTRLRPRTRLPLQGIREQRRAVVQCLTSAADQCGVESLVDELCAKLRDLEGVDSNDDKDECRKTDGQPKTSLESLTPRDRALRYYAAFPALQPATPKKSVHRKDKNFGNTNNNNIKNHGLNDINKNASNKTRQKKSKMSVTIETRRSEEKESYGFAKAMEREREKERELELDQLRLAQLQAKFDESLEALWDTGSGIGQDKASIWAAPSLSIPSGPLWPVDAAEIPLTLPISESVSTVDTPYQETIVDDSPIIPWDIDPIGVEKYVNENGSKDGTTEYKLNWSDYIGDETWCWKGLGSNLVNSSGSPPSGSCFFPVVPRKTPIGTKKEPASNSKVSSVHEDEEDLLTSARTHFRPIKDGGHWADGTTFPVNNSVERVAYRRSDSGNLLYLPGGESPYMEYRESNSPNPVTSTNLTLKFRVRQCDKCVQTEPVRSPIKRRILAEEDHFYYSSIDETIVRETSEMEKDTFNVDQLSWVKPDFPLINDRKRRHSSSLKCRPLAALRPLTL